MKRRSALLLYIPLLVAPAVRLIVPERDLDATGWRALWDSGFALWLLGVVLLLSHLLGCKLLRRLLQGGLAGLPESLFAIPLGLGVLGLMLLGLGLLGLLRPLWILLLMIGLAWMVIRELGQALETIAQRLRELPCAWKELPHGYRLAVLGSILIFGVTLLQALAPPADYDGLMYHLQAPKIFLQEGRIRLLPEIWQANGPFTLEMVFAVGLAFGSDVFAKLLHFSLGIIFFLLSFALARRFVGERQAWYAFIILLGIPVLPFWMSSAYADYAWATYELLAVTGLSLWLAGRQRGSLWLAGLAAGMALGSKYLAFSIVFLLGLLIFAASLRENGRRALGNTSIFLLAAGLTGAPWYVKNLLLAGNPVYPLVWGGPGWDAQRVDMLMHYLRSFGIHESWQDYLWLVIRLFTQPAQFGTVSIEFPSFIFLLVFLYPFFKKQALLSSFAWICFGKFVFWMFGSLQTRFLLAIFPLLAILAAEILVQMTDRIRSTFSRQVVLSLALAPLMLVTGLTSLYIFYRYPPLRVIAGLSSKDAYLTGIVGDYTGVRYILENIPQDERVLMMWDGRGYYCDQRCLADAEQSQWTQLVGEAASPQQLASQLQERGVGYLLFSAGDQDYLLRHDPSGEHRQAAKFFHEQFKPQCTLPRYETVVVSIYEITCDEPPAND